MEEDSKFEDSQDFLKFLFDQTPRTPELFIDLKKNDALNLPSISFEEEEELHTRRITEVYSAEIAASESKIPSAKIDDDNHQTLNLTLPVIEGHKETEVSKLQTEADSSPLFFILDANSTDNSSSISFEKEELHKRHQTEIYDEEIKAAKTTIDSPKIDNDKHHTLKFTMELSQGKKKTDVSKLKTKADSDPEKPVLHIDSMPESEFIQQRNDEQKAIQVRIRKDFFKTTTSPKPQIKISNGKKKFATCNNKSDISSVLPRPNVVKFEISSEGWKKAPLTELQSDEMQISFSSKFQESLKNKTCKNSSSSDIFCRKWRAIKPKSPNEQCQTLTKYLQTKSKEAQKFMPLKVTKKRHQAEEISQLRKKSCQKAATSNSPNKLCKASLYEESKMNHDEISESLVMQSEAFQNVLPSDSSKMEDKNYKNTRSSLLKNKTCINASSSGMCVKDCLFKKSLNLPNEPCQIIEGSSQTKSKKDQMLIQAKKRYLTGEISQLQKKLCHKAAMFELQNEMCKTPLDEQLKINQDKVSKSLVMQNEDFQNVFLSDSSKMKDKNYKNARSSLSKNKTCKNASTSSMCDKDCQVIKLLNPPNTPCQNLEEAPQTKSKENEKFILAKKRYLTGEIPQLQKKLCHEATTFEPKNEMRKKPLDEQLKTTKDQTSESFVLQSEGFFLSANSSKMQGENYKIAESPLLENKACKNDSSSSVCEKCCQAKPSNPPDEKLQTLKKTSQTKSKEEQSAMPSERIKKQHQTEEISQLQKKLYQKVTISKSQNKLYKIALTQRPEMNHDQISVMQTEAVKSIFPSDTSKMENENSKNAESLLLKNEICKNATLLRMHEKKLQAIKPPNLPNESYQTLEKSPETKSTEDQAIKPPNLTNESYQILEKPPQTKTPGMEDQAIKPLNLPNESYQTLEKSPQTKSAEDQRGVSLKLVNKRHREEEVSQLQKKLGLKATIFEPQNKICKTSSIEQPRINQDQVSESLIMQSEGFKNVLLSDSSGKVSEHGLSSAFNHERAQTTKQVLMKNVACQTEEEFLESHIKKDVTTVFTNVQNEKIQVVKHLALNAKQNRKRSPKPDVLPNTNIMLSRCLFKKAPISEFIKENCQAFADRKLQNKSFPTHSPTEIQTEEVETEIQPFIKNVKNRRNTPQLQSQTSQISKVLEPQNKQCLIEIASSSQNEMDQATTSLELQNKFISQQSVLSSSTQNKNAQSVSSSELQEEKCDSNQVTVKQTSSEMINEIFLCKINCDTPVSSGNIAHCTNISPLSALHGFVENVNPPGNYRNICTGFITSQVYNIRQSAPAMLDHEVPHSSLIISENHLDSSENHDNLERVNLNTNNYVIANQIAYPIVFENINITSFHNTDPSMLMHPYFYGSHEIFLNPVYTALINPSGFINNYCHFGGLLLSKENCAKVCLSCTNICNVYKPSASSTNLN